MIAPSNPYVSIWPILAVEEIRAALVARSVPCVAVSPLVGGRAVKGPADRMLARMAGGTTPAHVAGCYAGLIDALVVDESDPAGPLDGAQDRHADADDRPRRVAPPRRDRAGSSGMKVAVVGGTGSFGQAVAKRLVDAGVEVVIGSRDAERAREAGEAIGAEGASNDDSVRAVDLVLLAVKSEAAVDTARDLREAIGSTPVLSVCAELSFGPGGVKPTAEATSIAQRIQDELDAPVVAGLHSLAASNLAEAPPRRTRSSAATTPRRRSWRSSWRRSSSPGGRSTAARSRAPARSRG